MTNKIESSNVNSENISEIKDVIDSPFNKLNNKKDFDVKLFNFLGVDKIETNLYKKNSDNSIKNINQEVGKKNILISKNFLK